MAAALGVEDPPLVVTDGLALPRAVVAGLRLLATRAPLLVAIDDVQWLDAGSRRVLAFALRRLGGLPFGVLVTLRGGAEVPDPARPRRSFRSRVFRRARGRWVEPRGVAAPRRLATCGAPPAA